jgi:hypothetical protein
LHLVAILGCHHVRVFSDPPKSVSEFVTLYVPSTIVVMYSLCFPYLAFLAFLFSFFGLFGNFWIFSRSRNIGGTYRVQKSELHDRLYLT